MAYKKKQHISAEEVIKIQSYVLKERDALESKLDKIVRDSGAVFVSFAYRKDGGAVTAYHCQGATVAIDKHNLAVTDLYPARFNLQVRIAAEKRPTGLIRKLKQAVDEDVSDIRRLV